MNNITQKKSSSSVGRDFSAAFSLRFKNGSPVCYFMEPWNLFGISEQEFEQGEDAALAAAEDAQRPLLGNTENYEQDIEAERLTAEKEENATRERFSLMEYLKDVMRPYLRPNSPIMKCYKVPCSTAVTYSQGVDERGKIIAKVEGVCHDHSVHFCPMCSFKIAIGRALQVATIADKAREQGKGLYHMILTMRHSKYDAMEDLMEEMKEAKKAFWRNGSVREIYNEHFEDRIDTLEMMFGFDDENGEGGNGLHEHYHITLIGAPGVDCSKLQPKLEAYWIKALGGEEKGKAGGVALKLKPWSTKDLAHYLTKLPTASFEMAMGAHTKHYEKAEDGEEKKKGEHFGFFQVARIAMNYKGLRPYLEPLIQAYYFATKGKSFMRFSRGLLEKYGLKNKTDDELAEDGGELLKQLCVVSNIDYKKLTHAQIAESRILAKRGDKSALWSFFMELGIFCHENQDELTREWNPIGYTEQTTKPKQPNQTRGKHAETSKT